MEQDPHAPWYHTIELPGGATDGEYDLRSSVPKLPFPSDLVGKRCLDVGTHDGFWAFQMEAKGAAEVLAIDIEDPEEIDWPEPRPTLSADMKAWLNQRKHNFERARSALESSVQHRYVSVYDLSTDRVGEFDFAFIGTLLHHLRDPVGALIAIRRVLRGQLLVSAVVSVNKTLTNPGTPLAVMAELDGEPFWQVPNRAGLRRMLKSAGFEILQEGPIHLQRRGPGARHAPIGWKWSSPLAVAESVVYRYGLPQMGVLAAPVRR